jgi:hypothetical protein
VLTKAKEAAKEAAKKALAKVPDPESEAKEAEEVPKVTNNTMRVCRRRIILRTVQENFWRA